MAPAAVVASPPPPPPADEAANLLQNLSLDAQAKTFEIPEPTKKSNVYQYGVVESGANGQIQSTERSVTPFLPDLMDPTVCYLPNGYPSPAYYYGSYNGTGNEWDRFAGTNGVEMTTGVYGDNGSVMYHNGYGYSPYGPYSPATSPVPTEGQLYGPEQYQYTPYFQPLPPSSTPFTPSFPAQGELSKPAVTDQKPVPVDTAKGNSNGIVNPDGVKGNNNTTTYKPAYQNPSFFNSAYGRGSFPGAIPASTYHDARFGSNGQYRSTGVTSSLSKTNNVPSSKKYNFHQNSSYMGLHHHSPWSGMESAQGFANRMCPNKVYSHYGNPFRSGMGYAYGVYDSRINGHGWLTVDDKYKPRGRGNGYFGYKNESLDGLNELNRGPRAKKGFTPASLAVKGQSISSEPTIEVKDEMSNDPDCEQYNRVDFPEEYTDAKFFIIKSYSEDDVHKSIKYNVWASTPNGNKKLDAAYQEAQQTSGGCPVFLFFSVNTSGQFIGLAEMLGPVDFEKNLEYWQQDKWTGSFPLKWHIIKDLPNNLLKHITLENNENKPVTNSRDTQEVKLEQGLKMIKIFKEHVSKTCILDDFGFYEDRQKRIQEKKGKQQQFQKQLFEGKPSKDEKEEINESHKPVEVVSDVRKGPTSTAQSNGDLKHSENGSAPEIGDASKASKSVASEKKSLANGTANGC